MTAVYTESDANAAGYEYYTRNIADPGGENQVIMFKSCFPNSDMGGKPTDPPAPGDDLTVSSAKYTYNQLLGYFASRPDKLFIVITSPPMQSINKPGNVRAFSNWLVNDWLSENVYPLNNVAVFDFYTVLTDPDNHHRYTNGAIEQITDAGPNTLYYDSGGDDHPNTRGGQKATAEFIPLLNIYVNQWLAGDPQSVSPAELGPAESLEIPLQPLTPLSNAVIDDFENGLIPDTDYWATYLDEAAPSTMQCGPNTNRAYEGISSLQIDFNVLPASWASCELLHYTPQNWGSEGLQFYLQASQANLPFGLIFYYQLGNDQATSMINLNTTPESVGQWTLITIPWSEFAQQDSMVYPESGLGMAFAFSEGNDGDANIGTIWLDEISTYTSASGQVPQNTEPTSTVDEQYVDDLTDTGPTQRNLPFCGNIPLTFLLIGIVGIGLKRKNIR
ncbi:MAG: hypothetical protein IH629_02630 [Thermoleophilia bacterium]|nr:hypothetical protein [Thermoleophilia bacterium]